MKRILIVFFWLSATLPLYSQPINLDNFFPQHQDSSLWSLSRSLNHSSNKRTADSIFQMALENFEQRIETEGNLRVLVQIAGFYLRKGNDLEHCKYVLDETEKRIKDDVTASYALAEFFRMKAIYLSFTRNVSLLPVSFEKAYLILLETDIRHPAKPEYELNLMNAHFYNRKIPDGFRYFDSITSYGNKHNNGYYLASAYQGAANIIKFYNPDLAVKYFDYSYKLALLHNDKHFLNDPFFYISLGSGQTAVDKHANALDLYLKGLSVLNNNNQSNSSLKSSFYYYIGVTYKNLKDNATAMQYLDSALATERSGSQGYYRTLNMIGQTLNNAGRFDEALPINQDVLTNFIRLYGKDNTYFTQHGTAELSRSYEGLGKLEDALRVAHLGVCYFVESNDTNNLFHVPDSMHLVSGSKNYSSLENSLFRKIEVLQKMYREERDNALLPIIIKHFEYAQKVTDISASKSQTAESAYTISDRYKHHANRLLNFVFEHKLSSEMQKTAYLLVAKSKAYTLIMDDFYKNQTAFSENYQKTKYEDQLSLITFQSNPAEYQSYMKELLEIEKNIFINDMKANRKTADVYLPLSSDLSSLKESNLIAPNEIVIDYYITQTSLHAFVFTDTVFYTLSKPLPKQFESDIALLFKSIKLSEKKNIERATAVLWNILFKGIDFQDKNHLIIIPDEKLFTIPLELVLAQNKKLFSNTATSYRYNSFIFNKSSEKTRATTFTGFAPVFSHTPSLTLPYAYRSEDGSQTNNKTKPGVIQLSHLESSADEIASISGMYNKKELPTQVFTENQATKGNFKNSAQNTGILHIATHGIADLKHSEMSGLFFLSDSLDYRFEDIFLSLQEIINLQINADLVVLSACKSGYGTVLRGEGIMALSRGFMAAGAKNILASLWKVHDKKTSEFMLLFYSEILDGYSYAEALHRTKSKCRDMGWNPIDWAGFVLIKA